MRRASVSVPANIAEGFKRNGKADKIHFYNISEASLEEVKYFLLLSKDLGYLTDKSKDDMMTVAESTSKMLYRLCESIRRNQGPPPE